jgi:hypothetical protein
MIPPHLRAHIAALVDADLAAPSSATYPPRALARERAVLVHTTDALFAYYLAADGTVYELDMDSSRSPEPETDPSRIADVYAKAIERWPQLRGLR